MMNAHLVLRKVLFAYLDDKLHSRISSEVNDIIRVILTQDPSSSIAEKLDLDQHILSNQVQKFGAYEVAILCYILNRIFSEKESMPTFNIVIFSSMTPGHMVIRSPSGVTTSISDLSQILPRINT